MFESASILGVSDTIPSSLDPFLEEEEEEEGTRGRSKEFGGGCDAYWEVESPR